MSHLRGLPTTHTSIYVGRHSSYQSAYGEDYSVLGNPFTLRTHSREGSLERYAAYLQRCPPYHPASRAIAELAVRTSGGEALALICFCAPKRCHASIIARILLD